MGGRRALQRCCFSTFFNITTPAGQNALSFFTFYFFGFYSHFLPNVFLWTLSPISPTSQILFTFTLNFTKPFTPSSNTWSLSLSSHLTFLRNISVLPNIVHCSACQNVLSFCCCFSPFHISTHSLIAAVENALSDAQIYPLEEQLTVTACTSSHYQAIKAIHWFLDMKASQKLPHQLTKVKTIYIVYLLNLLLSFITIVLFHFYFCPSCLYARADFWSANAKKFRVHLESWFIATKTGNPVKIKASDVFTFELEIPLQTSKKIIPAGLHMNVFIWK